MVGLAAGDVYNGAFPPIGFAAGDVYNGAFPPIGFAAGGGFSEFPPIGFAAGGDTAINGFSFERLTAFDNCISKRDASINGCSLERDTAINSGFVCKRDTAIH